VITIVLRNIGFEGRHGATAIERRGLRRFEVDLEIDVDGDSGQHTDRLADTVDYSGLAEVVVSLGTGEPHRLLESLARRMVEQLEAKTMTAAPGARFRLELRKLHPPSCPGHPTYSAVRVASAPRAG
jgi:7,8-dihydroneopterin aldolase/epimerase/oxygenase